jgi:hypothetical protein
MNVLGHDHVAENGKAVFAARLLEKLQEQIAALGPVQERDAMIATAGDEVQLSGVIVALEASGHGRRLTRGEACWL